MGLGALLMGPIVHPVSSEFGCIEAVSNEVSALLIILVISAVLKQDVHRLSRGEMFDVAGSRKESMCGGVNTVELM